MEARGRHLADAQHFGVDAPLIRIDGISSELLYDDRQNGPIAPDRADSDAALAATHGDPNVGARDPASPNGLVDETRQRSPLER